MIVSSSMHVLRVLLLEIRRGLHPSGSAQSMGATIFPTPARDDSIDVRPEAGTISTILLTVASARARLFNALQQQENKDYGSGRGSGRARGSGTGDR